MSPSAWFRNFEFCITLPFFKKKKSLNLFFYLILFFNPLLFFLTFIIICFCFPCPVTFSVFFPPKNFSKRKICRTPRHVFLPLLLHLIFFVQNFSSFCDIKLFSFFFLHLSLRMMVYSLPFYTLCFFYCSSFWDTCVFLFHSAFRLVILFFVILRPLQKTIFDWVNIFLSYNVPLQEIIFANEILVILQNPLQKSIF